MYVGLFIHYYYFNVVAKMGSRHSFHPIWVFPTCSIIFELMLTMTSILGLMITCTVTHDFNAIR